MKWSAVLVSCLMAAGAARARPPEPMELLTSVLPTCVAERFGGRHQAAIDGEDVLKELKAARDTLNQPDDIRLMLVMSGSDRDKLSRLTNSKAAAFHGSKVKLLPLLDGYYLGWLSGLLAQSNPNLGSVNIGVLSDAFDILGRRPKVLDDAIGGALNPVTQGGLAFEASVFDHAQAIVRAEHARYADCFAARTSTQWA